MTSVIALPMHGYEKMLREGFRTRDAHIIEWLSRSPGVELSVYSRPEPIARGALRSLSARTERDSHRSLISVETHVRRLPNPLNPKKWWIDSAFSYPEPARSELAVIWNPAIGASPDYLQVLRMSSAHIHLDLLDDWTVHHAFSRISSAIESSYRELLALADSVSANSEGTIDLAERLGRHDAELIPNGVDPHRFALDSTASGAYTVGYVGKMGKRLDGQLVLNAARALPHVNFIFAGPILEHGTFESAFKLPNVTALGDVHYSDVPELCRRFDLGWVPHGVTSGQVGGDAIKIYEYRAAGLPVLTTPIIGVAERAMTDVEIIDSSDHVARIGALAAAGRQPRRLGVLGSEHTWQNKAARILAHASAPAHHESELQPLAAR